MRYVAIAFAHFRSCLRAVVRCQLMHARTRSQWPSIHDERINGNVALLIAWPVAGAWRRRRRRLTALTVIDADVEIVLLLLNTNTLFLNVYAVDVFVCWSPQCGANHRRRFWAI